MNRFPDWQTRLSEYLSAHRNTPFQWGIFDCSLFACDCVLATTGHDMGAWFRNGRYSTRKGAMKAIKQRTGGSGVPAIARYTANELGMKEVLVTQAQRGDMVLVGKGAKAVLGIVSLTGADVMCLSKTGIVRVAFEHVTAAWRVGN